MALFLAVVSVLPGSAAADDGQEIVGEWRSALRQAEAALVAGRWEEGAALSRDLVADMVGRLKSGDDSAALLALAVVHQALGEAGSGRMDDAVWHFHAAQNLSAVFRSAPLDRFGAAGRALHPHRLRVAGDGAGALPLDPADPSLRPPTLLAGPTIVFRGSARVLSEFDRELRAEVIIDAAGRVRSPVVIGSRRNPTPILASLEALREWRFDPASRGGKPAPVLYEIPIPVTRGAATKVKEDLARRAAELESPTG